MKGYVFKRKLLNPKKLKGFGALGASLYVYNYLPYIAAYFGPTLPLLALSAGTIYGLMAFAETQIINSIKVISEGEHKGKLEINVGTSVVGSHNIIVDVKDIQSVISLNNDDLGESGDGNVVTVAKYINPTTGELVEEGTAFTLPGDAFRDEKFMDWVISEKDEEGELAHDFHDLMI